MKALFLIALLATFEITTAKLILTTHKNNKRRDRKLLDDDGGPDVAVSQMDMFTNTLHSINSDLTGDRQILSMAKRQAYATLDDVIGKMSAKANESPMDHFLNQHASNVGGDEEGDERVLL